MVIIEGCLCVVRSSKKRLEKYTVKTEPEVLKRQITSLKSSMVKYQATYFKEISEIEARTKALIEKEGVAVFEVPNYLLFSREIFKLRTKFSKRTLDFESLLRLHKWLDRGLDLNLLLNVAKLQGVKVPYVPPTPPYPPMDGTANIEDVIKDLTFYKDSPEEKLTGILELTGDAQPEDVYEDRTFYNIDPKNKLTGTLPKPPIPPETDIFGDSTAYTAITESASGILRMIIAYPAWDGTVNKIYAGVRSNPASAEYNIKGALYQTNPTAKIEETGLLTQTIGNVATLIELNFASKPNIVKNRCCFIVIGASTAVPNYLYMLSVAGALNSSFRGTYTSPTMPATFPALTQVAYKLKIYAEYTPSS